jgi:hypothetical protein
MCKETHSNVKTHRVGILKAEGAKAMLRWICETRLATVDCRTRERGFTKNSDARKGSCTVKALISIVLDKASPTMRYQDRSKSAALPVKKPGRGIEMRASSVPMIIVNTKISTETHRGG